MSKLQITVVFLLLSGVSGWLFLSANAAEGPSNPSVKYIQRTMKALEESTAENPATVRVLFYGQSIVAQQWTGMVQKYLKEKYPTVLFEFANKAIGGYQSESLIRTAESDLYPWYPDLLFFHVYGSTEKYEEIVQKVRTSTTAEIVLWTSHLSANQDPKAMAEKRDQRSEDILAIADRNRCMVIDLNQKWSKLLLDNGWAAQELLADSVHLKQNGCEFYAKFIEEELVRVPGTSGEPSVSGTIQTIRASEPAVKRLTNGTVELTFTGNRVVAVSSGKGNPAASAAILLDGKPAAEYKELWSFTRPSTGPCWMPTLNCVAWDNTPVKEDWVLSAIDGTEKDGSRIHFKVVGSVTGEDGEGWSNERFVSKSGRCILEPSDFGCVWQYKYFKKEVPENFQIKWSTYPLFADLYTSQDAGNRTVLIQNCENGPHTLTIQPVRQGELGIDSFIIYAPTTRNE